AKAEPGEPGERTESGGMQLRAATHPWPDSTVTYTPAGERKSKYVYAYDAAGNQTLYESYQWKNNGWKESSRIVYTYAAGNQTLSESY
ncbi:MAG: hypothetical protein LBB90_08075, partial [Tannerella sp.]|nr:hypothetical protein [Tannerella sp.]